MQRILVSNDWCSKKLKLDLIMASVKNIMFSTGEHDTVVLIIITMLLSRRVSLFRTRRITKKIEKRMTNILPRRSILYKPTMYAVGGSHAAYFNFSPSSPFCTNLSLSHIVAQQEVINTT